MKDADFDMWDYWRGKYGTLLAISEQYPNLLKEDPKIALLWHRADMDIQLIDILMKEKAQKND